MMGFGGMGMTLPWLIGGLAVAAIWAGVFWIVACLGGVYTHARPSTQAPAQLTSSTWQQPAFTVGDASPAEPHPAPGNVGPEGATR